MSKAIILLDLDCFYAQVWMLKDASLRRVPVGVQQKGIIVTCNFLARSFGCSKLMSIKEARIRCPTLQLVSGEDLTEFRRTSRSVWKLLQSIPNSSVERVSLDEFFIELDIGRLHSVRDDLWGAAMRDAGANRSHFAGHVYAETPRESVGSEKVKLGAPDTSSPSEIHFTRTLSSTPAQRTVSPAEKLGLVRVSYAPYPATLPEVESALHGGRGNDGGGDKSGEVLGVEELVRACPGPAGWVEDDASSTIPPDVAMDHHSIALSSVAPSTGPEGEDVRMPWFQVLRTASWIAAAIRRAIRLNLGLTTCAGVSTTKLGAKTAASLSKPNLQSTILPSALPRFLSLLPPRVLPGVGYAVGKALEKAGVKTVNELSRLSVEEIVSAGGGKVNGKSAAEFLAMAKGEDVRPVIATSAAPKSISDEDSFRPLDTIAEVRRAISHVIDGLSIRLAADYGEFVRRPQTLRLTIRRRYTSRASRSCPFPASTSLTSTTSSSSSTSSSSTSSLSAAIFHIVDTSLLPQLLPEAFVKTPSTPSSTSSTSTSSTSSTSISSSLKPSLAVTLVNVGVCDFVSATSAHESDPTQPSILDALEVGVKRDRPPSPPVHTHDSSPPSSVQLIRSNPTPAIVSKRGGGTKRGKKARGGGVMRLTDFYGVEE